MCTAEIERHEPLPSSPSIAILLLTATLAGVLAHQAWDAARSQRATAEGALRDYASFAAWEFSLSAKDELYKTLVSVFGPVAHQKPLLRGADHERPPPQLAARSKARGRAEKGLRQPACDLVVRYRYWTPEPAPDPKATAVSGRGSSQ